jgi:hypothetical protein
MKLILLALALLPQQEPPDRAAIRERLIAHARNWCHGDTGSEERELARMAGPALEELPVLIKESEGDLRRAFVGLYGRIADWKNLPQSPGVILNLARGGTAPENLAAARVVLKIRDERAMKFLIDGLTRIAAGDCTQDFALERLLFEGAGKSHSNEAGKILLGLIDDPNPTMRYFVIEALGTLGYWPARDALKKLTSEKDINVRGPANHAIEKIEVLPQPGLAARMVLRVRGKRMSGEFSWYRWSLEQIVHHRLTEAAPALREDYDEFVKKFGTAKVGNEWSAVLLHAIQTLGGKLSPEEITLLHDLGRLPPAVKVAKDDEPLKEGFAAGVWAPREQRQKEADQRRKEAEARRAPPPRIPEEKLPRIMEDRIRFVMNLKPPDPSYLAPNAALALAEIERMLKSQSNQGPLLEAYLYLARLRDGMKTPDVILDLARAHNYWAMQIATTIADERAEAWFLEEIEGPGASHERTEPGRLSGPKVKEALLKYFRANERPPRSLVTALVDMGCVEILPELKFPKGNPHEVEKLTLLAAPDRDAKLLTAVKSLRMSGEFSWYSWGLDQILRHDFKHLAPELRTWFDAVKVKWTPSHNPNHASVKVPWVLFKLGAPISPEERELLMKSGRIP